MDRFFGYGISAASPFIGLFFSIRLNAFLYQWLGACYPSWIHLIFAALFFWTAWLLRKRIATFLIDYAYGLRIRAIITYIFSLAAAYFLRGPLLYSPILGTDINSPFVLVACIIGCGFCLGAFLLIISHALRSAAYTVLRCLTSLKKSDLLYLLGLLIFLNAAAYVYMALSKNVYYWDNAGYWETTHTLAELVRSEGAGSLLKAVYNSVAETDYNYLIALPGTLLCLLFGKSRYVFITGIVNVYLFPLYTLLYLYIRRRWKRHMFITSGLVLFFPSVLYNALVGFVDVAGVIPCLLAVLFYFHGDKQRQACYPISGLFLAMAVLLRRWYAFFAAAFLISAIFDAIAFKRSAKPLAGVFGTFGFILLFFFQRFVSQRLLADYGSMYSAYQMGIQTDILIFFRYYGVIITAGLILVGIYMVTQRESRQQTLFLLILGLSCFFLFTAIQTHGQQHLYLYMPTFFWLGAQAFAVLFGLEKKPGAVFAAGLVLALLPTGYCLIPRYQPSSIQEISSPALIPSFTFKPVVRSDIDDLLDLTEYMDSLVAGTDKKMAVLSSSLVLNESTLRNVELSISLKGCDEIDRSYLLSLPQVDSRDSLPEDVGSWDYVLVASPIQTHLGEENQRVVTVPAESFLNGTDIALAYTRLPEVFTLTGTGIDVYIFERSRDISVDEYELYLTKLQEALPEKFIAQEEE